MWFKIGLVVAIAFPIIWTALGTVKPEDLSQEKYPSSPDRW